MSLRPVARAAAALVPVTYALLVFGSTVRVHGAGLACPDWPLCFGQVVPQLDFQVLLEWGHRTLAGLVSLAFLAIGIELFRRGAPRAIKALWGLAAVLLATQVVLGGLTVLELLAEWTVTSHLLTGNSFCVTLLLLALALHEHESPVQRPAVGNSHRAAAGLVAVAVFAQLALGGFVASSHAGLACGPAWPACAGDSWFPTFQGIIGLQVMHRIMAYTLLAAAAGAVAATRGQGRTGRTALIVLALVGLQAVIGIANVVTSMPVEVTIAHSAGADAIVLAVAWLNWEAWRAPAIRRADAPSPALLAKEASA